MYFTQLDDLGLKNKRVLIREDFNVPLDNGKITSDARIRAALPTIQYALKKGAAVILLSHLDRPPEGNMTPEFSLAPIAVRLGQLLGQPVRFITHWLDGFEITPGEVVLCENVRFQRGEKKNDPILAKKIAQLGDIFVMDAFATAHRVEASTVGAAQFSPQVCAGFLLTSELNALSVGLENPSRPLLAIVGGSKVSTKLTLLSSLLNKVNFLMLGGGIANTFLVAQGYFIGRSLYEPAQVHRAKRLLDLSKTLHVKIILPTDVIVANEISNHAKTAIRKVTHIKNEEMILDIGPESMKQYTDYVNRSASILWNGPLGAFEWTPFQQGTRCVSEAIANSPAFSIAGGGDTLAAIEKYGVAHKLSYISTGGGAFLEFLEGKTLPILTILHKRQKEKQR
ncbi:phosphoglycerate kinase [Rickettsiella grylli]|uniref:Phosphoglycerate kinase n=1 Tax=Rickettsiella grylli TaxID=59196 RepID=A8PKZ3_9COXI|nr:phosphoglycerate kinase [Rickettsiella grylli]EDP47028.1 phosphoglycerate kinase [Rickettsiella grylli]